MLNQYRRHFIRLNMCLIGIVLILMLMLVSVYLYHDYYNELNVTMSEVVKPLGTAALPDSGRSMLKHPPEKMPQPDGKADNSKKESSPKGAKRSAASVRDRKNINTIFYTPGSQTISILSSELIFDEELIKNVVPVIVTQPESFGILKEYNMIYYYTPGSDTYKIAITDIFYLRGFMIRMALILGGVFIAAMVLFYFISCRISLLAIQPLADAMEREKQFVADASHDMKTPLTVILANSSILQSNPQSSVQEQMKWIDSTAAAAQNMQAMVNSLLTLSHVEARDAAPQMERVSITDIAQKAVLQMESVAYDSEIELKSELEPDLYIRANAGYLLDIISSLIENALKYEPKHGSVLVRLHSRKGHAVLTVANPNAVIAPEDLPHIFERFYRADKTRNAASGHGLGLAIVQRMTHAIGGDINAVSSREKGTAFCIRFKLR